VTVDAASVDLARPPVALDPFPVYEALREQGDVHHLPRHDAWIVLGHDTVGWALDHADLLSSSPYEDIDGALLASDPPRHLAVRRAVARRFGPALLTELAEIARDTARRRRGPELEVVAEYGMPISHAVAAALIGIAEEDAERLARQASAPDRTFEALEATLDQLAPRTVVHRELLDSGDTVVDERQVRSIVRLLWRASTKTTTSAIASCAMRLVRHPDLAARMAADPRLVSRFVDEVLRLHGPETVMLRRATSSIELAGRTIPPGATVLLCLSAANRDPARFERPTELLLERPQAPGHVAFGRGVHRCMGAGLARQSIVIAVEELLAGRHLPRERQPLDTIDYIGTLTALRIRSLVVALRAG
jgi:cytochrome P450